MNQIEPNNMQLFIYPTLSFQQKHFLTQLLEQKDLFSAIPLIKELNNQQKYSLDGLENAIQQLEETQRVLFFQQALPKMAQYSLDLIESRPNKQLLISEGSIEFTRKEIYQFLSLAFFGLLHEKSGKFPSPCNLTYVLKTQAEKTKCFLHYFITADENQENEIVKIERISFNENYHIHQFFPNHQSNTLQDVKLWSNCEKNLLNIDFVDTYIEEQENSILVDFANKYVGGGVLQTGCVQEEILFTIMPENIIAVVFCKVLNVNEVLIIKNTIRYCDYLGYGFNFKYLKREPKNLNQNILVLDARNYRFNPIIQYLEEEILRELNKAFIGFSLSQQAKDEEFLQPISTGKWGCGAFEGDVELKTIIQLLAFSASRKKEDQQRKMIFSTFNDKNHLQSIKTDVDNIIKKYKSVGILFSQLMKINRKLGVFQQLLKIQ